MRAELSCYTANLPRYLARHSGGDACWALDRVAASVRLAVRADRPDGLLAFSHHCVPLDVLDGRTRLAYTGAATAAAAIDGVAGELAEHGQVLVLADSAALPWAPPGIHRAPHLLLLDGRRGRQWHAVDDFTALRPEGEQRPFAGWITTPELLHCLTPISPLPPVQRLRNEHAFGFPVPLPATGHHQWLTRIPAGPRNGLGAGWVHGVPQVIDLLARFWSELDAWPLRVQQLDDMWAAAQHHTLRYTHLRRHGNDPAVLDEAAAAWRDLPMALHFAAQSSRRGRPRPALVAATFARLRQAELAGRQALPTDPSTAEQIGLRP